MPIVTHLDRLLLEHRMTLTELAEGVGVTITNCPSSDQQARAIRFSTWSDLPELGLQPGDLLA